MTLSILSLVYLLVVLGLMGVSMLMLHKSSKDLSQKITDAACDLGMVNCRLGMTGYLLAAVGFATLIYIIPSDPTRWEAMLRELGIRLSVFSVLLGIIHYKATALMYQLFR